MPTYAGPLSEEEFLLTRTAALFLPFFAAHVLRFTTCHLPRKRPQSRSRWRQSTRTAR